MTVEAIWSPKGEDLVGYLEAFRFRAIHEFELQALIEKALKQTTVRFEREARLSSADRIDFLVHGATRIGIEVKVDGSVQAVTRQLHRYAQLDTIQELVLFTTRSKHRGIPRSFAGKPIHVIHAMNSFL